MADQTSIEWTDATWNPVAGCSLKSPGCRDCYAMPMARRHELMSAAQGRVSPYAGLTKPVKGKPVWTGELRFVESALTLPLRTRKPRLWFVNSMSDLFHEDVPDAWIDRVFAVMACAYEHTFQVLTKRSNRARAYLTAPDVVERIIGALAALDEALGPGRHPGDRKGHKGWDAFAAGENLKLGNGRSSWPKWPLQNVWIGVSAEDQTRADERVPDLLATPAAVRFVSAEPLLGPIDFTAIELNGDSQLDALRPTAWAELINQWRDTSDTWEEDFLDWHNLSAMPSGLAHPALDWIIVGDESGPNRRPCDLDHVRSIRDQCEAAGTAFFLKQLHLGGKKVGLPVLDSRAHSAMPEVRHG